MTTRTTGRGAVDRRSMAAGSVTLALGMLFTAAVAYTYILSLSATFNPPNWVRILGLVWLPIGFAGVPVGYALARTGAGRQRGLIGVLIRVVGLIALVALVSIIG